MTRYLLTISFKGTNYHGWQVQKNACAIQEVFQDTLTKIIGKRIDITGCSRTDSGVHANRYCLHFDLDESINEYRFVHSLNALLPLDIAVITCEKVSGDFHARYSAVAKEYIYKIWNASYRNPFIEDYSLHIKHPLNIEKMNEAAQHFLGKHDFLGFCSIKTSVADTTREINCISVAKQDDLVTITVQADGFLYNMVRIIVGTLIFVSEGKIEAADIPDIIVSKDRKRAGKTARACGLYLNNVIY